MNFNEIDSLVGLECPNLQKLFISHNRLTSLFGIENFTKLNELSVFSNQIINLNDTILSLSKLPNLKNLDLGGNPCASIKSSKSKIFNALKNLERYNGDLINDYMRDEDDFTNVDLSVRPQTAPPKISHRPPLLGGVKLFRNEEFNKNEILMEYMAHVFIKINVRVLHLIMKVLMIILIKLNQKY